MSSAKRGQLPGVNSGRRRTWWIQRPVPDSPHRRKRAATMRTRLTLTAAALLAATLLGTPAAPAPSHAPLPAGDTADDVRLAKKVAALVEQDERRLVAIFKHLHANPELGFQEVKTA